ncbi:protein of unknown function [Tenacibaculum sp. 190524A02b]|uniref:hypothetical protein n=1 Tax=Tenacibaculum vairaonense TaxID=3137860 RepID=UPI0032B1D032
MESITNKIKALKKIIPFKWRVQRGFSDKSNIEWVSLVPYVDARDVQNHLDKTLGEENWQDEYYQVKGTLMCKVGVLINGNWVWKSGAGAETTFEKQKGEASDAFKRACLKWGVNRDAYELGEVYVKAKSYTDNKGKKQYQPMDGSKKLKGQALYDFCNNKIDMENMPNFNLEESNKSLKELV